MTAHGTAGGMSGEIQGREGSDSSDHGQNVVVLRQQPADDGGDEHEDQVHETRVLLFMINLNGSNACQCKQHKDLSYEFHFSFPSFLIFWSA